MLHFRPRVTPAFLRRHSCPPDTGVAGPWDPVPASTDWDWFMAFVARGGEPSRRRYESWIERRSRFAADWADRFEEFKRFRHEALYLLRPSDFGHMRFHMGKEHALGKLDRDEIVHDFSKDFSPPIPMMYPFHALLEDLGRLPRWSEAWTFLTVTRPDLVLQSYAAFNRLSGDDPRLRERQYMDALQWRVGAAYYSWVREVHLLTELRCTHRLDVRYHFAVDAEWKADLVGGDVLLEVYINNRNFKDGNAGRKETCAEANPWAKTVRVGFDNQRRWGRPYFLEDPAIEGIAHEMAEAGCPRLP